MSAIARCIQRRAPERPDRAGFGAICAIARNDAVRRSAAMPRAGSAPGGTRGSARGRRCRRETTPTTGPVEPRAARPRAAWNRIAAIDSAPDGSTTSRASSAASRTAAAISSLGDGDDGVERTRRWAKLSAADRLRARPVRDRAARPAPPARRRSRPAASDSRASAASSGSTPMTRASGASARDRRRDPAGQPAAADRDEDSRDVGQVLGDLEPDRALAGDDPRRRRRAG